MYVGLVLVNIFVFVYIYIYKTNCVLRSYVVVLVHKIFKVRLGNICSSNIYWMRIMCWMAHTGFGVREM